MARKMWVVVVDDTNTALYTSSYARGGYVSSSREEIYSPLVAFFNLDHAKAYAKSLTTVFPNKETYICENIMGFSCQTTPVVVKHWDKDGSYMPGEE